MEINLKDIMSLLLSKMLLIILVVLLSAGAGFAYTYFFVDPTYTASAKLVARNKDSFSGSITSSDIAASQSIVSTCMNVLTTEAFLDRVSEKLESKYYNVSNAYIRNHMSCKHISDTEIFTVQITTPDPNLSYDIANAISELAPEIIPQTITVGELRLIDSARMPTSYSWPLTKNAVIGAFIGAVAIVAIIVIKDMLDTTVRTKKDLEDKFGDIPVIGAIPKINKN
ncbi:MAG: YveK family protein [Eubacteriales bacterium]